MLIINYTRKKLITFVEDYKALLLLFVNFSNFKFISNVMKIYFN